MLRKGKYSILGFWPFTSQKIVEEIEYVTIAERLQMIPFYYWIILLIITAIFIWTLNNLIIDCKISRITIVDNLKICNRFYTTLLIYSIIFLFFMAFSFHHMIFGDIMTIFSMLDSVNLLEYSKDFSPSSQINYKLSWLTRMQIKETVYIMLILIMTVLFSTICEENHKNCVPISTWHQLYDRYDLLNVCLLGSTCIILLIMVIVFYNIVERRGKGMKVVFILLLTVLIGLNFDYVMYFIKNYNIIFNTETYKIIGLSSYVVPIIPTKKVKKILKSLDKFVVWINLKVYWDEFNLIRVIFVSLHWPILIIWIIIWIWLEIIYWIPMILFRIIPNVYYNKKIERRFLLSISFSIQNSDWFTEEQKEEINKAGIDIKKDIKNCNIKVYSSYTKRPLPKWFIDNIYNILIVQRENNANYRKNFSYMINLILGNIANELSNLPNWYNYQHIQHPKVTKYSSQTEIGKVTINRNKIYNRIRNASFGKNYKSLRLFLLYDIVTWAVYGSLEIIKDKFYNGQQLNNYSINKIIVLFLLLILNEKCINNDDIVDSNKSTIGFLFKFASEVYSRDFENQIKDLSNSYKQRIKERRKLLSEIVDGNEKKVKTTRLKSVNLSQGYKLVLELLVKTNFNMVKLLSLVNDDKTELKELLISNTGSVVAHDKFWNKLLDFDLYKEGQSIPSINPLPLKLSKSTISNKSHLDINDLDVKPILCKVEYDYSHNNFDDWIKKNKPEILIDANYSYDYKGLLEIRTFYYLTRFNGGVFYLNPYVDFRGRIYYDSILSPTHNKYMRQFLKVRNSSGYWRSLSSLKDYDVSSSMLSIIFSLFGYSKLVGKILSGEIDMHLLFLHFINKNLKDSHPWKNKVRRSDYKVLSSPLIYGATMKSSLRVHVESMFLANKNLHNLSERELKEFLEAVEECFKQLFNRDHFIKCLFNILCNIYNELDKKKITHIEWVWYQGRKIKYLINKTSKVISRIGKYQYVIYKDEKKPDLVKMKRGILANFIHSFDSKILWEIINDNKDSEAKLLSRNIFYTVHDSFFVDSNYVDWLIKIYTKKLDSIYNYGPISKITKEDRKIILPLSENEIIEYWYNNYLDIISLNDKKIVKNSTTYTNDPIIGDNFYKYVYFWDFDKYWKIRTYYETVIPLFRISDVKILNDSTFFKYLKLSNSTCKDIVKYDQNSEPKFIIDYLINEPDIIKITSKEILDIKNTLSLYELESEKEEEISNKVVSSNRPKIIHDLNEIKKSINNNQSETIIKRVKGIEAKTKDIEAKNALNRYLELEDKKEKLVEKEISKQLKKFEIKSTDIANIANIVKDKVQKKIADNALREMAVLEDLNFWLAVI